MQVQVGVSDSNQDRTQDAVFRFTHYFHRSLYVDGSFSKISPEWMFGYRLERKSAEDSGQIVFQGFAVFSHSALEVVTQAVAIFRCFL